MSKSKSLPLLVLNRNYTMVSTFGHAVHFEKGKPTYVPPAVYQEALSIGAQPEDGQELEAFIEEKKPEIPLSPIERAEKLGIAIATLIERNSRTDFTAAGAPTTEAISREVGFKVSQKELLSAWQRYHEQQAEASD